MDYEQRTNTNPSLERRPRKKHEVYVPPCAGFCPVFKRENCVLDPRTQEKLIGITELDQKKPQKQIIIFLGMPGAGKSTQINEISSITEAPVYHMGKFAKSIEQNNPELKRRRQETRAQGKLLEGLDELFLAQIINDTSETIILDGFPRSIDQLVLLQDQALINQWQLQVVYVSFPPENAKALSLERQVSRFRQERGHEPSEQEMSTFLGKIDRAVDQDLKVVEALLHTGVGNVVTIDGTKPFSEVNVLLRESLQLDYERLDFDTETFQKVSEVSGELGIEAWLTGGSIYRAFWNNVYGPMQESTDIDISVSTVEEENRLQSALEQRYPQQRWAVLAWEDYGSRAYDVTNQNFSDSLDSVPVTYRQAVVRMKNGKLELQLKKNVEADLRNGVLRMDNEALNRLPEGKRKFQIDKIVANAQRQIIEYPGLVIEGELKKLVEEKTGRNHSPIDIKEKWGDIDEEVQESEFGGRPKWSHQFSDEEKRLAENVVQFFHNVRKEPSAPPKPKKSRLPGVLEDIRKKLQEAKLAQEEELVEVLKGDIRAPEGYSGWLEYVCLNATDAEFREWLLNQVRSRTPIGGKDPTLVTLFNYEQFENFTKNSKLEGQQKVTHQGWELDMHLKEATFQLVTDEVAAKINNTSSSEDAQKLRLATRLAMLYHDGGKLLNVNTPGSHEGIGAKLFLRCRPEWISDEVAEMTAHLIRLHDVFGRLSRGLCEKEDYKLGQKNFDVTATPSYKGALDPQIVRDEISHLPFDFEISVSLVAAVWKADVGSVASLRWLLPIADHLEKLIISGHPFPEKI
jgi:adenylate kinase family enzyme